MSANQAVDPELLRRIQALELKAREVAEGVLMGIHHAPHRGRSLEFEEHKEYTPGDDIRRIDWKVYAKSDRFYVKEFEDDTNITALILVDASRSMAYRSQGGKDGDPSKLEAATTLAGALSYMLLTQSDAVGMGLVREGLDDYLPPRARHTHFHEITRRLAAAQPRPGTDIAKALAELSSSLKGRAMVLLFSDLLDEPGPMLKAIRLLRHRRHELVLFHVLDPDEIEFPFDRLSMFRDMEGPLRLLVDPKSIRMEYTRHVQEFIDSVRNMARGHGIDYWLARTDARPAQVLSSWLAFRAATTGARARSR